MKYGNYKAKKSRIQAIMNSQDSVELKKVAIPFLPKMSMEEEKHTYTLVLDLDETLIHYEEV
jgi:predicted secreted acid phosphatase